MVYVKKEGDIEIIKIKGDRCYHYIGVKKEEKKSDLEERETILRREIAELKIRLDIAYKGKQYWEEAYSTLFDEWNEKMNELYPTKLI